MGSREGAAESAVGEQLSDSWVCVASGSDSPKISIAEQYLQMLKDARAEPNFSSDRMSLASSRFFDSPESLPNTPMARSNAELSSRCETPDYSIIDQLLQMLRDAQKENNYSSYSPKSPPNSPAAKSNAEDELGEIFINYRGNDAKDTQSEYDSLCLSVPSFRYTDTLQSPSLSPASGYEAERGKTDTPPVINRTFKRYVRHRRRARFLDREFLVSFVASNAAMFVIGTVVGLMFFHMR